MKFTVSSTAMANKLAAMAKVMNNKPALPILSTCMARLAGYYRTGGNRQSVHHGVHLVGGSEKSARTADYLHH